MDASKQVVLIWALPVLTVLAILSIIILFISIKKHLPSSKNTTSNLQLADPNCSSSSSSPPTWDVFLSFYGKDTRRSFISHLYSALDQAGILTFRDDPALEKGQEISSGLLDAIKYSKIFIIVVSENYARSPWCLDELLQILSCKRTEIQVVPVFYYVDPSDVRHHKRSFGEALDVHKKRYSVDMIEKWKSALSQIAELSGYHLRKETNEVEEKEAVCGDFHLTGTISDLYQQQVADHFIHSSYTPFCELLRMDSVWDGSASRNKGDQQLVTITTAMDEPGPSKPFQRNKDIMGDQEKFPLANFKTDIKDAAFNSLRADFNIPKDYIIYRPDPKDYIYQEVRYGDLVGLGISRTAFYCGLRVPIHAFVRKVVEQTGVALAQLTSNSFIHINSFLNRCLEKKVSSSSRIFWHHFILSKSSRSPGFFAIALRPGRQKWSYAPNNNKRAHKDWVYIFGPGLDGLNRWVWDPSSPNHELDNSLEKRYSKMLEGYSETQILEYKDITSELVLLCLRVSGLDVEKEKKREAFRKSMMKAQGKQTLAIIDKATISVIDDADDHVTLAELREKECSDLGVETVMSKRFKASLVNSSVSLPKEITCVASPSSIGFGRQLSSLVTLPNDLFTEESGTVSYSEQACARLGQTLTWIVAQAQETADLKLQMQTQTRTFHKTRLKAEGELARLREELDQANKKNDSLSKALTDANSANADLEKKVVNAQEAERKAQEEWYNVGFKDGEDSCVTHPAS